MVGETSDTWLNSLKQGDPQATGWKELASSYGRFVRGILLHRGVEREAAEDITQNVMMVVVRRLPEFRRQRPGSFRAWLRSITANCLRDYRKAKRHVLMGQQGFDELIQAMDDPRSELTRIWDRQHTEYTLEVLLDSVKADFTPSTVEAFRRLTFGEQTAAEVARQLGMSPNACLIARSRVLKALRERLPELFDEKEAIFDLLP